MLSDYASKHTWWQTNVDNVTPLSRLLILKAALDGMTWTNVFYPKPSGANALQKDLEALGFLCRLAPFEPGQVGVMSVSWGVKGEFSPPRALFFPRMLLKRSLIDGAFT